MRNKYKETFDKISFSADFEQRVIGRLDLDADVTNQKTFIKRDPILIFSICGMIMICIIGICVVGNFYLSDIKSNSLSKKEMQQIVGMENIEIVRLEKSNNLFKMQDKSVNAGEMIIVDCGMEVSEGDMAFLQAEMKGADVSYDIGYIIDGDFICLQKNIISESLVNSVVAEKKGNFYWCISNISDDVISLSASMQYRQNDLVYRDYGSNGISVNEACIIRLGNIQSLLSTKEIKGIYLYDYEQKNTKEFPANIDSIEYEAERGGTFFIYAVTKDGEIVSLNRYASVEYSDTHFDTNEDGEDEKSTVDHGIINL